MSRVLSLMLAIAATGCSAPSTGGGASDDPAGDLSWRIPVDVDSAGPPSQRTFEDFAWQSFVALNWPATADGSPDSTVVIGQSGDAMTVWEFYKSVGDVFLAGGDTPAPWSSPAVVPPACRNVGAGALPVLRKIMKPPTEVVEQFTEPFEDGPVIDQNGAFARFGIRMNRVVFDYIVENRLYRVDAQEGFGDVAMPSGGSSSAGSMTLKSAWKILGSGDPPERFHTMGALVYTPASDTPPTAEDCTREQLGLVGFHITQKTPSEAKWVWATFEQVDNVTVPAGSGLTPSFYDPACDSCTTNVPTTQPWDPTKPGIPTQVVREDPIFQATDSLNAVWQARLRGVSDASPWQYYQVVGVQRPTQPNTPQTSPGDPTPEHLANSLLETFVQGSSTCMGCHIGARSGAGKYFADYSYLFIHADPSTGGSEGS